VHWGVIQISVTNALIIVEMLVLNVHTTSDVLRWWAGELDLRQCPWSRPTGSRVAGLGCLVARSYSAGGSSPHSRNASSSIGEQSSAFICWGVNQPTSAASSPARTASTWAPETGTQR
jgi:hypothetical protein